MRRHTPKASVWISRRERAEFQPGARVRVIHAAPFIYACEGRVVSIMTDPFNPEILFARVMFTAAYSQTLPLSWLECIKNPGDPSEVQKGVTKGPLAGV